MVNKDVWPISARVAKYGRLCKECLNCNDHSVEDDEAMTHTRLRCPEFGVVSPWHKTRWVQFEMVDGFEIKTDQDGKVTRRPLDTAPSTR